MVILQQDEVLRSRLRAMVALNKDERYTEAWANATTRAEDAARLLKEGPSSVVDLFQSVFPFSLFKKK
jgi:hypothetical protein